MLNEKAKALGYNRSTIRELFEYGRALKETLGDEHVFDFSLGNPSVTPPEILTEALDSIIKNTDSVALHGYTSAEGAIGVRKAIAKRLREEYGAQCSHELIYMTAGAAAALTSTIKAVSCSGESVIVLSPYFPEYKVFIEAADAVCVPVSCRASDFRPDIDAIASAIDEKTAAIIINSPNNPTGVVYTEEDIKGIADLLSEKSREYSHPIYIIADEPYRELVYDGASVPFIPNYYANTVVCYSYSKSLSIPGDRIGYAMVPTNAECAMDIFRAICGAGRSLGFVCAPSLLQKLIEKIDGETSDIDAYNQNRLLLLNELTEIGFEVAKPDGAFYLFVKSPSGDGRELSERAKKHGLLLVPSDDFGCRGYVRIAYCQSYGMIKRSLPVFRALMEEYK